MPKFTFTAKVTSSSGATRTETGTVEHPSPAYDKARAKADAADYVSSGDRDERINVNVRYAS